MKSDKFFLRLCDVMDNLEKIPRRYSVEPGDKRCIEFAQLGLVFIRSEHIIEFENFMRDDYWPNFRAFKTRDEAIEWAMTNNVQSGTIVKITGRDYIIKRAGKDQYQLIVFDE